MAIPQLTPEERQAALEKAKAARIKRAQVRDDLKSGKLTRPGDTAACLPAGVVIRLDGSEKRHDALTGRICP